MQRHHRGTPITSALVTTTDDERRVARRVARQQLRAARRALPIQVRRTAARRLARRLARAHWLQRTDRCTAYHASDGELDAALYLRQRRAAAQFVLPRIIAGQLQFATPRHRNAPGRFGIPAPRGRPRASWCFDVVLLPLVAFSRDGTRLGRGGGYYDRALVERPGRPRPLRVGIGFSFQELPSLPSAPWDARLDLVVTPEATVVVSPARTVRTRVLAGGWATTAT